MQNLARQLNPEEVTHLAGHVVRATAGGWLVRTRGGEFEATRAASCLLEPRAGDRVTLALVALGGCYVVDVLERKPGHVTELRLEGDVRLDVSGRLGLGAKAGLDLVSGDELRVVSGRVHLNTIAAEVVVERATYVGKLWQSKVEQVRQVAATVELCAERLCQRLARSYRFVAELDQLRAESIDQQASGTVRLHGRNAVLTAAELVQVDGEQIHMG